MNVFPCRQTYWDTRAAGNFALGGSGSGLIAWASVAAAWSGGRAAASLTGACLVCAGLLLVWFEIGRPARFLNVLRNPRTSWMSREAWAAVALLPLTILSAAGAGRAAALGAAFAALVFLYCQARILRASRGIPAWRQRATPALIVTTGLAEGGGLWLLFETIGAGGAAPTPMRVFVVILAVVRLVAWSAWLRGLEADAPVAAVSTMRSFSMPFVVAGHLLPIALVALALSAPVLDPAAAAAGGVLLAASGWALKARLVLAAGHTQGFALNRSPARGGGRAGAGVKPGWR